MAVLTLSQPGDVLGTALVNVAQGTVQSHSSTSFVVKNPDTDDTTLDSDDTLVAFTGTNFGNFDSHGVPHSGTITEIQTQDFMFHPLGTLTGLNLAVSDFLNFVSTNNLAGLEAAIFSGDDTFNGSTGADSFSGLDGNDTFNLMQGGNDIASGGNGNDTFNFNAAFTAADQVDGGAGTDTLSLNGDYSAGVTLAATTMVNVETISLVAGHSYKLTTNDANVASGQTLTVNGSALGAADVLTFNGAAETNGIFSLTGGAGNDVLTGGAGSDTSTLSNGGNDIAGGGNGNDIFSFGAAFTAADQVDGGAGADTLSLNGDYSAGVTFAANTMVNVETIGLAAGHSYKLTTNDANVASGQMLTVDGSALGAADVLTFNGAAETNGRFTLIGGAGNDTFTLSSNGNDVVSGGSGNDAINFGAAFTGSDQVDGGAGADTLSLNGDYSAGVTFAASTMVNVETVSLAAGHSYKLTTNDANVASGQTLAVNGSALGAADVLTFNGAAETDGNFSLTGGAGNDVLTGGAGADTFILSSGGNDIVSGGNGNDTFSFGAAFSATDQVDGGGAADTLSLNGDYSGGVTFAANTMVNVETISFTAGHSYKLTTNDANVASGQTLTMNGSALGASDVLTFNGAAETNGIFSLTGGAGNDVLTGGAGNDTFTLSSGGNDIASGGNGNDSFSFGAAFTATDQVDGGAGADTLSLNGDYSGGVTFAANTMVNIETISLTAGHSYNLTTNDANVAAGQTLSVNGSSLGAADVLTFNGAVETNGIFSLTGGAGNDVLTGGAGADTFNLGNGGNDIVAGGNGNDAFFMGSGFTAADQIDGGAGADTLSLNGDYSAGVIFAANTMINVENISFIAGHSYKLITNDANVASGQTLTVNGSALGAADVLTFNGAAETNGIFSLTGGAGNDVLTGGAGNDTFILSSGGNDVVSGGGGNDTFNFGAAFTASDQVDGGAGTDTLTLNGDYSAGVTLAVNTMINIENISFAAGHSYALVTNDANVAGGQILTVNGSALGAADALTFNGAAETNGVFFFTGGAGNDVLTGGAGNDAFNLSSGGNDILSGGAGNDVFNFSAAFTASDQVDGGAGTDTLTLNGDYSAGVTLAAGTMVNVDIIGLTAGHSYKLTTNDANVASGQVLTVNGSALGTVDVLTFNGAAEIDGKFSLIGGAGNDVLTGGAGNDTFTLTSGGDDIASGGSGNDNFNFGAAFTSADQVDGGIGSDTLTLNGDYSAGVTFAANTMVNVETISLAAGHSYKLTTNDANVAAGQTLTVNGSTLGATDVLTFNGAAETNGNFSLTGGVGNDVLTGGAGNDTFTLSSGGNDIAGGGSGNDTFAFGGAFTATDQVDGGAGADTLSLNGDYSAGVTLAANTMVNVETISLAAGHSYKLTTNDANVAAGQTLTLNGSALGAADVLTFSGAAETDGAFSVTGGAGNDVLTGGAGNDTFTLSSGGSDIAGGGSGNDTFTFGAAFTAADQVDGGVGTDMLLLNGDYSAGVTFASNTMVNIETIKLSTGHSYKLTTNDANVASGQTLVVNGSALGAADALTFNGAAETNGKFTLIGGAGNDVLTGGSGKDQINGGAGSNVLNGGGGADTITAGAGADTFVYSAVSDSTGKNHDVIKNFDASADKFDFVFPVTGVDTAIASGTLSKASFNADLASAVDAAHLGADHAVLFTVTAGTFSGHTFLVVDANGAAGYQANQDFVFDVTGASNLASLNTSDFI